MKERNTRGTRPGPRAAGGTAEQREASLDDLRRLVLGPEQERLDRLEDQLPPTAESIGALLPEAGATPATTVLPFVTK